MKARKCQSAKVPKLKLEGLSERDPGLSTDFEVSCVEGTISYPVDNNPNLSAMRRMDEMS